MSPTTRLPALHLLSAAIAATALGQSPACEPHASPGCLDTACQAAVCPLDPFCCSTEWDQRCATEASVLCAACHPPSGCVLPPASIQEAESCGTASDDPCAWPAGTPTPLPLGATAAGRVWASDTSRDVDWFQVTLPAPGMLTVRCFGTGPIGALILDQACPPTVHAESVDGCPSTCAACLPAGTYRVAVRPLLFEALECSDPRGEYRVQATLQPCQPQAPANDRCDAAQTAALGPNAFDASDASSEPAWLPSWCDEGAGLVFTNDVWFSFTAPGTALYHFSTCGLADFDSRLAAYAACGATVLACSDDACPDGGASIDLGMTCGETVLLRVGGWGHGAAGSLLVARDADDGCACPGDLDGSGEVDCSDVSMLLLCFGDVGGPADLDGDGEVGTADIGLLLMMMGPCG